MKQNSACVRPFSEALKENLRHSLPEGFYAALGVFSAEGIGYLASKGIKGYYTPFLPYVGPSIIVANTFSRLSEVNSHEVSQVKRAEAMEEILSQTILNTGVYFGAHMLVATFPAVALPVIGTFVACEVLLNGDNAPIDYIRDTMSQVLHFAHIGDVVDYIM